MVIASVGELERYVLEGLIGHLPGDAPSAEVWVPSGLSAEIHAAGPGLSWGRHRSVSVEAISTDWSGVEGTSRRGTQSRAESLILVRWSYDLPLLDDPAEGRALALDAERDLVSRLVFLRSVRPAEIQVTIVRATRTVLEPEPIRGGQSAEPGRTLYGQIEVRIAHLYAWTPRA